jgi:hypothetical protein
MAACQLVLPVAPQEALMVSPQSRQDESEMSTARAAAQQASRLAVPLRVS